MIEMSEMNTRHLASLVQGLNTPAAIREAGEAAAGQGTDADCDQNDESFPQSDDDDDFQVSCRPVASRASLHTVPHSVCWCSPIRFKRVLALRYQCFVAVNMMGNTYFCTKSLPPANADRACGSY